jgi:hypothetical protein
LLCGINFPDRVGVVEYKSRVRVYSSKSMDGLHLLAVFS